MSSQFKGLIFVDRFDYDPSKVAVTVLPAGAKQPTFLQVTETHAQALDLARELAETHDWPIKDLIGSPQ